MKAFRLPSLFIAAMALTFSACEKNAENIKDLSENKAASTSRVVYPFIGTDMSDSILPIRKLPGAVVRKGMYYPDVKVKLVDTVCADYLRQTKKLDFSYLKDGDVVGTVRNNDLVLTVDPEFNGSGFQKLSHGTNGWWTHWNYLPYTEYEHPIVLFPLARPVTKVIPETYIAFSFNKRVKAFGFEIAPNAIGKDFEVSVAYHESPTYRDPGIFFVEQTISSPSGARLIAVESDVPIVFIEITVRVDALENVGFAIANLRYALAD